MPEAHTALGLRRLLRESRASSAVREAVVGIARRLFAARQEKHPFDRAHRVDTDGLIYASPDAPGHAAPRHNAGYYATAPSLFHGAIDLWRATLPSAGYAIEDYTLIDIGCGKGRVLMLSTLYPFREITGIELDPQLARIARKNLRSWTRVPRIGGQQRRVPQVSPLRPGKEAPSVHIVQSDALSLPLPDTPVALFYFNSFEREMTEKWLSRLAEQARPRTAPLDLIYIHPEHDVLVRRLPAVLPLAFAEIQFSPEDAASDAFGVASDQCAIYRIGKPEQSGSGC
jgi:hypothetical protein